MASPLHRPPRHLRCRCWRIELACTGRTWSESRLQRQLSISLLKSRTPAVATFRRRGAGFDSGFRSPRPPRQNPAPKPTAYTESACGDARIYRACECVACPCALVAAVRGRPAVIIGPGSTTPRVGAGLVGMDHSQSKGTPLGIVAGDINCAPRAVASCGDDDACARAPRAQFRFAT